MNALSQLLAFNPFKGASWENLGGALNGLIGRTLYYVIICGIGRVADICQLIFRKFAGISTTGVTVEGQTTTNDIAIAFLESSIVQNLFFALIILAVVILLITTFAAIIRTEFAKDGNNNKKKVIKNAFRGLVNFLIVPVVSIFALIFGNILLRALDGAISNGSSQYISSQIFIAGAYDANRARNSELDEENNRYKSGSFGALLAGVSGDNVNGYSNFGIFLDDKSGINQIRAADKIDTCFSYGYAYKIGTGLIAGTTYSDNSVTQVVDNENIKKGTDLTVNARTIDFRKTDFYYDGMLLSSLNVNYVNESGSDSNAGVKGQSITFNDGEIVNFSYYNVGLVYYYYDLSLTGFNYLVGGIAMVFAAWTLLLTVLGLIKRIFMITTLFVVSAPICAIYPLDEGKALGNWRSQFIKETLAAYSVVVVMNLFLSLLPVMSGISVFVGSELGTLTGFGNYFARVLIVLGGLTFFKGASKTISEIIGAGDSLGDSNNAKGDFKSNIGRVAGAGALIGGISKGLGSATGKGISAADKKIHANSMNRKQDKANADTIVQSEILGKAVNSKDAIGNGSNSMGSAPIGGSTGGSGGSGPSAGGAATSTGSSINSSYGINAEPLNDTAKKSQEASASQKWYSSSENVAYNSKERDKHTRFYNATVGTVKAVHNANITRKIRGAIGGLTASVGGIISGKGKVKDAYNWKSGTDKFQKAEKDRSSKVKEAQENYKEEKRKYDESVAEHSFQQKMQEDNTKSIIDAINDTKNKKDDNNTNN